MGIKTVLKVLLSKFARLSVDMQQAVIPDKAIVNNLDTQDVTYVDNEETVIDKEAERVILMINDAKTIKELKAIEPHVSPEQLDIYNAKEEQLKAKK